MEMWPSSFFFPLVTSARLVSRSQQLKCKSYYYRAWSRADILAMNEAVSSLGNPSGQARDMIYTVRAETPALTDKMGLSQRTKKHLWKQFSSESTNWNTQKQYHYLVPCLLPPNTFKRFRLSFLWPSPLNPSIFLLGKFQNRQSILKTSFQSSQVLSSWEQTDMETVAFLWGDISLL